MKILFSSQDFGYGATTQLFSIIQHLLLRGFTGKIGILNNTSSRIFYQNFIKKNRDYNIVLQDIFDDTYDVYVGVYDPKIIFYAKRHNKKNVFLCNLTFLWDDKFIGKYDLNSINIDDIDFNVIESHHELIILAYIFADKVFIRSSDKLDKNSLLYSVVRDKISYIGPIIYPRMVEKGTPSYTLIQLGGQVNPIVNEEFICVYFQVIKRILDKIEGKKVLCINPILENLSKKYFLGIEILPTMSQYEYQQLLSQSTMILSPFGINTYFESTYFNTPTYLLPEQHLGHIKSLLNYFSIADIRKYGTLLYTQEPYSLEWEREEDFIQFLFKKYLWMISNDGLRISSPVGLGNIMIDNNYESLVNKDIELLLDVLSGE